MNTSDIAQGRRRTSRERPMRPPAQQTGSETVRLRRALALGLLAVGVMLAGAGVTSAATDSQRCAARKIALAKRFMAREVNCQRKWLLQGFTDENERTTCLTDARAVFARRMEALKEKSGCVADGAGEPASAGELGDRVEECVRQSSSFTCLPTICCGSTSMVGAIASGGEVRLGGIPFPLPSIGGAFRLEMASAQDVATCEHEARVSDFVLPPLCALGSYTVAVEPIGCLDSTSVGTGHVWSGTACCAPVDVSKVADSSDGLCDDSATMCNMAGAGANQHGAIDKAVSGECHLAVSDHDGDGVPELDVSHGMHALVDVPVHISAWASPNGCPDPDQGFDPGTDTLVAELDLVLTMTSGTATAAFEDTNGDGCAQAGDFAPVELSGAPATGPCCTVGQQMTMVAAAPAFTGTPAFLGDVPITVRLPLTITECNELGDSPPPLPACTIVRDAPCPLSSPVSEDLRPCSGVDTWRFDVAAGQSVSITADTLDAESAADLCFEGSCPASGPFSADNEIPCTFPLVSGQCPQATFTAVSDETCSVQLKTCGGCSTESHSNYGLGIDLDGTPATLSLVVDDAGQ